MEKRVILAVVLSFVVLYVYQAMFAPKPVPRPKATQTELAKGSASPGAGQSASPAGSPGGGAAPAAAPAGGSPAADAAPAAAVEVADTEARDVVIEAGTVHAVFTNRGAVLKSWRLNRYKDQTGKPVDLVPQTLPDAPRPFQIETGNSAVDARSNAALFGVAGGGATRDEAKGTHQVAFEYREAGSLSSAPPPRWATSSATCSVRTASRPEGSSSIPLRSATISSPGASSTTENGTAR